MAFHAASGALEDARQGLGSEMTRPAPFRIALVGLPATGKTTYIAALWAYLRSGLSETKYRVTRVPDDTTYLNVIAKAWSERKDMPRNSPGATDRVEFTIEVPNRDPLTVVIPDLPGEMFLNALRRPSIDEIPAEAVTSCDLLLLFVNGKTAKTFAPLGDHEATDENETEPPQSAEDATADNTQAPNEFAIDDLDSDTLNTELLHRLGYLLRDHPRPATVVVVSAWDVVDGTAESPEEWLKHEQPMTWQYIDELRRTTRIGVVGISAQGADYDDDPKVHHKTAYERSWGRDVNGNMTDIAGPLLWHDGVAQAGS